MVEKRRTELKRVEKGMRGDEMANGDKKSVRMDSEHMGNKEWERRGKEDGEKGMEKMEKGENTKGSRQDGRGNKDQKDGQRGRGGNGKEEMEARRIC